MLNLKQPPVTVEVHEQKQKDDTGRRIQVSQGLTCGAAPYPPGGIPMPGMPAPGMPAPGIPPIPGIPPAPPAAPICFIICCIICGSSRIDIIVVKRGTTTTDYTTAAYQSGSPSQ